MVGQGVATLCPIRGYNSTEMSKVKFNPFSQSIKIYNGSLSTRVFTVVRSEE